MTQQSKNSPLADTKIEQTAGGALEIEKIIKHLIGKSQTVTLVQVVQVNSSGVSPVGTVDVLPLVHQLDGAGNIFPLGKVFDVPYFRLQGGKNAVICDPVVGDIGICLFASRDISTVKRTKKASAPPSRRQYDWSDGLYIGGVLNGTPSQYVYFSSSGIKIVTPNGVEITAGGTVNIISSSLTHNGVNIGDSHVHGGVSSGGSKTGTPS